MRSIQTPVPSFLSQQGSSLVETLVAVVLGLLALVFCSNSVLAVVVGENRSSAVKALTATLEFARDEAVQRHTPVGLCGLDPRDANAASGEVRCADADVAWAAGWIVYSDANLNGQLDDGEAVLQVSRDPHLVVRPEMSAQASPAITFRPMGTLASAAQRRLLVSAEGSQGTPLSAVCVAIDGHMRVLPLSATCQ